uniref:Uncharacterized protein n=1 Tax=Romanomermis culicivorax TaxID=13658 RepID=A0A915JGP7_ROMCU
MLAPAKMTLNNFLYANPQYKCLCGLAHVRTGVLSIAGFWLLVNTLTITAQIYYSRQTLEMEVFWPTLISNSVSILFNILLILGVIYKKPTLLIIHLINQFIGILITAAFIIICGIHLMRSTTTKNLSSTNNTDLETPRDLLETSAVVYSVPGFGMMIFVMSFQIWCFSIVVGAYKFLKDEQKMKLLNRSENAAQYRPKL